MPYISQKVPPGLNHPTHHSSSFYYHSCSDGPSCVLDKSQITPTNMKFDPLPPSLIEITFHLIWRFGHGSHSYHHHKLYTEKPSVSKHIPSALFPPPPRGLCLTHSPPTLMHKNPHNGMIKARCQIRSKEKGYCNVKWAYTLRAAQKFGILSLSLSQHIGSIFSKPFHKRLMTGSATEYSTET